MKEVRKTVVSTINTIKEVVGRRNKEKRKRKTKKEKKLLVLEREIEKKDIMKMKRILRTKGGIEKVKKKARRKIEIMKLQMEIENEITEGEIRNRRRIAENAKMFKFGCKFVRKKENEQPIPEAEKIKEFLKELFEKEDKKEKQEIGEDEEETKIKMWEIEIAVKRVANWKCPGPDGIKGFWWKYLSGTWGSL